MLRPTEENLLEILRLTESATTRDPQFAHAFALLAGVERTFPGHRILAPGGAQPRRARGPSRAGTQPGHPGPFATLASIAAHRAQWVQPSTGSDGPSRSTINRPLHARHGQMVLVSAGRLKDARDGLQVGFPSHPFACARRHADGHRAHHVSAGMRPKH